MNDALTQFRDAIRAAGLEPPNFIEPGKFYRFPGVGKRIGNTAGWCRLFDDGLGGCFGDWSSGFSENWHPERNTKFSLTERTIFARRAEAARIRAEREKKQRQRNAANKANAIWNAATDAPENHPYLIRKGIPPFNAKLYKNALVLPVMDFSGQLNSVQFIEANGNKRLLSGGRKQACFIPINRKIDSPESVIICEGWATGCTLAEDKLDSLVLAAIDAGNLESLAVSVRCQWPSTKLIIAGDDDRQTAVNTGAAKAKSAAIASCALLALPQWPDNAPEHLTDFNDLSRWIAGGES